MQRAMTRPWLSRGNVLRVSAKSSRSSDSGAGRWPWGESSFAGMEWRRPAARIAEPMAAIAAEADESWAASKTTAGTQTHPAAHMSANRWNGSGRLASKESEERFQYHQTPPVPASAPNTTYITALMDNPANDGVCDAGKRQSRNAAINELRSPARIKKRIKRVKPVALRVSAFAGEATTS